MAQKALAKEAPAILKAAQSRSDSGDGSPEKRERRRLEKLLIAILLSMGLEKQIRRVAAVAQNLSLYEWLRVVKNTFGIDLDRGQYGAEFFAEAVTPWVSESVEKMKEMPKRLADRIMSAVAKLAVLTLDGVLEAVNESCGIAKRAGRSLAADQIGNLNSSMSRLEQEDAGCSRYIWSTMKDSRVRESHRVLEGKTCSWADPPLIGGRHLNPGEDWNCRCVAVPVFERDSLKLRTKGADGK